MASLHFEIVDVFSDVPFNGNPLAVVDVTKDTLTTTQMQLIARQFNLSETTFVLSATVDRADFRFRSFLPDGREVFGAGHNILGAWWHLARSGKLDTKKASKHSIGYGTEEMIVYHELGQDVTSLKIQRSKVADDPQSDQIQVILRQAPPKLHANHPDPASLAEAIGISKEDIGWSLKSDRAVGSLQPQVLSTSTTYHLLVPLASTESLNSVKIQRDKLIEQLRLADERAYGLFLFTPVGNDTYEARFFSPGMSAEDPATGSAAGPLSAYLYRNGALTLKEGRGEITVRQGLQVGRECVIRVVLNVSDNEKLEVDLVGGGVEVVKGTIVIPSQSTTFSG
jgi:trans-2,3-dihydro-3-hydroxyanthranilate isomerase